MKFGKQLKQTVAMSLPEWQPNFIDYKDLKKKINGNVNVDEKQDQSESSQDGASRSSFRGNSSEFLEALRAEVEKVNNFYLDMEEDFIIRFQFLASRVDAVRAEKSVDRARVQELCRKLIDFQSELVLLESFSAINYTGFRKILKKHDKKTGLDLRNTYLLAVLETPFFLSSSLRKLMSAAEKKLHSLEMFSKFRRVESSTVTGLVSDSILQQEIQPIVLLLENGDQSHSDKLLRLMDESAVGKMRIDWRASKGIESPTMLVMDSTDDHFIGVAVAPPEKKIQFRVGDGQIYSKCIEGRVRLRRGSQGSRVRECSITGPWPAFGFKKDEFLEWENASDGNVFILTVMIPGFHGELDQFDFPVDGSGEIKISNRKTMITILPAM